MVAERTLVRNFYRALIASAYVAGATAVGGPPAGAVAIANLASPLGVATVELGADQATRAALDSTKMATGGLVTQPTFAMLGEAGPEMVIPIDPNRSEAEYMRLRDMARRTKNQQLENQLAMESGTRPKNFTKKRSRSQRTSDKKLSRAFREANSKMRLKNGQLRRGKTQSDVAKMAHRLLKKMK